jgi:hypothetical protein
MSPLAWDRQINADGDTVADRVAEDIDRVAEDIGRIADALDDFLAMSLAAQGLTANIQAQNPAAAEMLRPLTDALAEIAERRRR